MKIFHSLNRPVARFMVSIALLAFVTSSCSTYYHSKRKQVSPTKQIDYVQSKNNGNYVVMHIGKTAMRLESIEYFSNDHISAVMTPVDSNSMYHNLYQRSLSGRLYRIPNRHRRFAKQLHIYVSGMTTDGPRIEFKESDISRIDRMNIHHGAGIGAVVGVTAASMTVFLAIACNCPRVYTTNGEQYNYSHSLFTGAVGSQMERNDYQVMPDYFPNSTSFKFMIRNDLDEKQCTNKLQLIVAQHDDDVEIMADQNGKLHSISEPIKPLTAVDDGGADLAHLLLNPDDVSHAFNNSTSTTFSNSVLTFDKPKEDGHAKLVIRAKNHQWGSFVYDQFLQKFGHKYDEYIESTAKKSREEIEARMNDQGMPLVVSILNNGKWVDIESINLIGDIAYNNIVVPISKDLLSSSSENIQIRLRSGYMFWEVDYVAMDFGQSTETEIQLLNPSVASNGSESYVSQLSEDDDQYMQQLQKGDSAVVEFIGLAVEPGKRRTIILNSKGYYISTKEYDGKVQRTSLAKFRKEGAMSVYSRELAEEYLNNLVLDTSIEEGQAQEE